MLNCETYAGLIRGINPSIGDDVIKSNEVVELRWLIGNLIFYLFVTAVFGNGEIFNRNALVFVLIARVTPGRFARTENCEIEFHSIMGDICSFVYF